MNIKPSETILKGQWILKNNQVVMNDVCMRIIDLTQTYLIPIGEDASGWNILYRDPADGRFWELTYPQSELEGGGPPQLECISFDKAKLKYGAFAAVPSAR